jgi:hypothetical protein
MSNIGLIIVGIGVIVYLIIGFGILKRNRGFGHMKASIFNPFKKKINTTSLEKKVEQNVISTEEYEWEKSKEMGTPIGDQKN